MAEKQEKRRGRVRRVDRKCMVGCWVWKGCFRLQMGLEVQVGDGMPMGFKVRCG